MTTTITKWRIRHVLFFYCLLLCYFVHNVWSYPLQCNRRSFMACVGGVTTAVTVSTTISVVDESVSAARAASAATTPIAATTTTTNSNGLAEKLSKRDASVLTNSVFNLPPPAQVYPTFMRGSWDVNLKYAGYLFPSQKISRERLTQDYEVPGFQKCSIAALCDVGKESVDYILKIDPQTGLEDRQTTFTTSINAHLTSKQKSVVREVLYNPKSNPNRLSIIFEEYQVTNAERIELFCNGRESELIQRDNDDGKTAQQIFVCSEYIRQVTFGTGSQVGVPRQIGTNYAHFWTWKSSPNTQQQQQQTMTGNLLTAAYLDPQDSLFFEEPSRPVAVYSHLLTATRIIE
jgi:hypothetical protein